MILNQRIKYLPKEVIQKIAAGEVVERPSNVLKELIENSLDAKATEISVFIEKGGKKLIQVKDNGIGIYPDDLPYIIERHTTSKISSLEDLYALSSYGFRGEALYSISAVSKFSIISKPAEFSLGKEMYVEGGEIKYISE
ncbi:MAG: DNA mismatch repair protein MutL, partial [Candidatus Nanohaloarchaeota archaeon]|nr:DNA mismatch repair protein MutL [Candidatus Nanohaloarchaeota archaeon]